MHLDQISSSDVPTQKIQLFHVGFRMSPTVVFSESRAPGAPGDPGPRFSPRFATGGIPGGWGAAFAGPARVFQGGEGDGFRSGRDGGEPVPGTRWNREPEMVTIRFFLPMENGNSIGR